MKQLLVITERFDFEVAQQIKALSQFEVLALPLNELTNEQLARCTVLIIRSKTIISASSLDKLKQLQLIISCTAGFDHIDLNATQAHQIQVCYTPRGHTHSAAEQTWALLLASQKKLMASQLAVKTGQWDREPLRGFELSRKTLGLVGLGRIGQKVAQFAQAFDMKLVAHDPYQEDAVFNTHQAQRVSFQELLLLSDIVSFHVPKTKETHHMLRVSHLEDLPAGLTIINTSRGDIIDPQFLLEGIKANLLAAVALDVYHKEPYPTDSPLLSFSNVYVSPHTGANTHEALQKVSLEALSKLNCFLNGQPLDDTLPLQGVTWASLS